MKKTQRRIYKKHRKTVRGGEDNPIYKGNLVYKEQPKRKFSINKLKQFQQRQQLQQTLKQTTKQTPNLPPSNPIQYPNNSIIQPGNSSLTVNPLYKNPTSVVVPGEGKNGIPNINSVVPGEGEGKNGITHRNSIINSVVPGEGENVITRRNSVVPGTNTRVPSNYSTLTVNGTPIITNENANVNAKKTDANANADKRIQLYKKLMQINIYNLVLPPSILTNTKLSTSMFKRIFSKKAISLHIIGKNETNNKICTKKPTNTSKKLKNTSTISCILIQLLDHLINIDSKYTVLFISIKQQITNIADKFTTLFRDIKKSNLNAIRQQIIRIINDFKKLNDEIDKETKENNSSAKNSIYSTTAISAINNVDQECRYLLFKLYAKLKDNIDLLTIILTTNF
jgi:hypothetical protein